MENWTWGLSLIALTIVIHVAGIVFMALAHLRIRLRLSNQTCLSLRHVLSIVIGLTGVARLLLTFLHGLEAALWATAYWCLGAIDSPAEAILYSVDTIRTRGASGLMLERHWRMMGALEAVDGMLLFGISTAYVFTVMQSYWSLLAQPRHP